MDIARERRSEECSSLLKWYHGVIGNHKKASFVVCLTMHVYVVHKLITELVIP